jgi:predicted nucleic acid-binding protein
MMAAAIIETTIIVDLLRYHPPATGWYADQINVIMDIHPIIWMESIQGGANKIERLRAARLLKQFEMIRLTEADQDWAMERQMRYQLQYGVGLLDCLIASVSHRLQIPLYTHNLKHFQPLLGTLAQRPY